MRPVNCDVKPDILGVVAIKGVKDELVTLISVMFEKAVATSVADMALIAVNVRPATVSDPPAASAVKPIDDFSVVTSVPCVVLTTGTGIDVETFKSGTLPVATAVKLTTALLENDDDQPASEPVNTPEAVPFLKVPIALPDAPLRRLAKAEATCASVMSVDAVKVNPATVTELPADRPLNVTAAFSVAALIAWFVTTEGGCADVEIVKSTTLFEFVEVNETLLPNAVAALYHPVNVPVN